MRLLLIGTGARASVLTAALAARNEPGEVFTLGTGMSSPAEGIDMQPDPITVTVAVFKHRIDLVVIDPEFPGADRIAGGLDATGTTSIGAGTFATRAAASRTWTLQFLADNRIPTVNAHVFDDPLSATVYAIGADYPLTVALDRPATPAHQCRNPSQAASAIESLWQSKQGERLLLRRSDVPEVVVSFLSDGLSWRLMPYCRDLGHGGSPVHRDLIPAAATPAPVMRPGLERIITKAIIAPFHSALAASRLGHRGFVTARIALDPTGPRVVDFYPGLLDTYAPLTLPLLESDLGELLAAAAGGRLAHADAYWSTHQHAVSLSVSGPAWPPDTADGVADRRRRDVPGAWIFETRPGPSAGEWRAVVVGTGSTFKNARNRAYARAAWVRHDGLGASPLVSGGVS
jgi:phosphoribosylamine---glycine ligase